MLSRSKRLPTKEFDIVIAGGKILHSTFFILRFTVSGVEPARISAVAPKKMAKTAVSRNKIRRRIYEASKPLYQKLKTGVKGIVFAKESLKTATFANISQDLGNLFVKAGILK